MECVALRSAETASGTKSYIVCSVMTSLGEEVTCKGKVCGCGKYVFRRGVEIFVSGGGVLASGMTSALRAA